MTAEDDSGSPRAESQSNTGTELADAAIERARAVAEEGKENAAQQIGTVASAIRGAAGELERQMPKGADLIRSAATTLETGAEQLRQRSVDEWLQSFGKFTRDEPAAVFGGAIIVGFALARFFNSSRPGTRAATRQG